MQLFQAKWGKEIRKCLYNSAAGIQSRKFQSRKSLRDESWDVRKVPALTTDCTVNLSPWAGGSGGKEADTPSVCRHAVGYKRCCGLNSYCSPSSNFYVYLDFYLSGKWLELKQSCFWYRSNFPNLTVNFNASIHECGIFQWFRIKFYIKTQSSEQWVVIGESSKLS